MQDNYTPDVNPDWVEEGWAGMQQLLNQEMPLKERKPAVWVWATAISSVIALGLAFWLIQATSSQEQALGQFPIPGNGLASASLNYAADDITPLSPDAQYSAIEHAAIPSQLPPKEAAPYSKETATNSSFNLIPKSSKPAVSDPVNKQHIPAISGNEIKTSPTTKPSATTNTPAPAKQMNALSVLNGLPFTPVTTTKELSATPTIEAVTPVSALQHWSWGLMAGGWYGPNENTRGLEAGTFLNWRPQGSKWYGRLQLSYLQIHADQRIDERLFAYSNSRAGNNNQSTLVTLSTNIRQLNFARTAFQVGYDLSPRLAVEGGICFAYLINATQEDQWTGALQSDTGGGSDGSEELTIEYTQKDRFTSTTGLTRGNLGFSAGLRYQINSNLFTSLQYIYPAGNFLETPNNQTLNRNIALSLFRQF